MLIRFEKPPKYTPETLLRRCGFRPWSEVKGKQTFIRRLNPKTFYPRFHLILESSFPLILNLHLDSRRPMHKKGIRTYESETEVVQNEAKRIREILEKMI